MIIGDKVCFSKKVFKPPYVPFYDAYKGHIFKIVAFHYSDTHVELECVSDVTVKVNGFVHPDELLYA